MGISKYTQSEIFNLIAAILHLGNLQFEESEQKQEPCKVKNPQVLQFVADLLGVSAQDLETSIVYRTKIIKREMCSVFLSSSESANQRDALAMTIYSLLFSWILEQINSKLVKDEVVNFVGIVDFTGTDQHLKKNGFDRLLSNLANEKLYNFVMKRLIDEDIETLKKEKLVSSMASVSYVSNQMQLDFLLGSPDMGLLSLIDTESARLSGLNELAAPQDSSQTPGRALLGHLIETYPSHPLFHVVTHSTKLSSKKKSVNQDPLFTIKHSAGSVEYDASSFLETNLDQLYSDFVILVNGDGKRGIGSTENEFLRELFSEDVVYTRKHWKDSSVLVGASTSKKPLRTPSISRKRRSSVTVEKETLLERDVLVPSLWSSFQSALDELILSIEGTTSWYAFTLSPNSDSSSATAGFAHDRFDPLHVQAQIGRLALAEIAEARRECHDYIISMELADFLERFKLVVKPVISRSIHPSQGDEARVKDFCEKSGWKEADYAIGSKTGAIYLAEGAYRSLTDELKEITERMKLEEKEARRNGTGKRRSASQEDGDDSQSVAGSDFESDYEGSVYESDLSSESATIENKKENRRYFSMRNVNQKPPALLSASSSGGGNFKDSSSAAPAKVNVDKIDPPAKKPLSAARKRWLCLTWSITWWSFPFLLSWIGGMKRADIRMAWREKFTICVLIFLACCSLLAFIILPGYFICPTVQMISTVELEGFNQPSPFIGYTAGRVFHLDSLRDNHILNSYSNVQQYSFSPFYGQDLSAMFYPAQNWANYCPNIAQPIGPSNSTWDNIAQRPTFYAGWYPHQVVINGTAKPYLENLFQYSIARVAWDMTYLTKISSNSRRLLVISGNVYDVSSYFNIQNGVFGQDVKSFFSTGLASNVPDATGKWKELVTSGKLTQDQSNDILNCMKHIFYVGVVDTRNTAACKLSNYTLLAASIFICAIIFVKFLAALRFGQTKLPENHDKFVILQMPCYTEGPDSLQKSLESLAAMRYDDKRKLLFVICDGMVVGSGNNRPTPRIVLDILGVDPNLDPEPFNFQSLGDGDKQHNMGKVYSGLYEVQGHSVPYIVVVKVGKPSERQKPGNRGKRDSQMILMRFLSRVHFNSPMAPLELEIYRHLKYIIGVNPSFYEYILMVDADTEVHVDALNRMISCMIHDSKIMGLCGETLLSNQNDSIITMIQVYEYFISHHLAKAFESLFGTVTCLPGCFSMYRIRTPNKNVPLIIAPPIITDYSENSVETLHLKVIYLRAWRVGGKEGGLGVKYYSYCVESTPSW